MRVIKHSFHLISAPLTNIINLSLQKGIFPDKLKFAKVILIYKANDPSLFTNYRPISLLSNFSIFFEKVMYNRMTEFAEQYNILYSCKFGFRKYSLRHRKCGVRGFIHELFVSKTRTSEVRASDEGYIFSDKQRVNITPYKALSMS